MLTRECSISSFLDGILVVTPSLWSYCFLSVVDSQFRARLFVRHLLEDLFIDLFGGFRVVRDAGVGHALPCPFDNLVRFAHATVCVRGRIPNDAYRVDRSIDDIPDAVGVESNDHTGQVVGAEPRERMVDENPGGFLGVVDVTNEFDGFLVTADIPEL